MPEPSMRVAYLSLLESTDLLLPQDSLAPTQNPAHFCCLAHIISLSYNKNVFSEAAVCMMQR